LFHFFFFQAEDGIRDRNVTGVQTCALPILAVEGVRRVQDPLHVYLDLVLGYEFPEVQEPLVAGHLHPLRRYGYVAVQIVAGVVRSEERRVGKECRSRWWANE